MDKGILQIYTGNGKGKTTAAIGLAVRSAGAGLKVIMIQFLKSEHSSELNILNKLEPDLKIYRFNSQKKFIWNMNDSEKEVLKKETVDGYKKALEISQKNLCDVLILDEILGALYMNYLSISEIKKLLNNKMEIILTGQNASDEMINMADLVTEMKKIKHPFDKGLKARLGIEK
jgi:cob(I)alamin adenosyltransferase